MFEQPLGRDQILDLLAEVAAELRVEGPRHEIVVVGGSLLALHGLRKTTHDVDSVRRLDPELRDAVATVAARNDLAPRWLNDSSAAWVPETLDVEQCAVLFEHPRLLVRGAPFADVFLMKLNASRARDVEDLVVLWPLAQFATPAEAVEAFYRAYPLEEHDPYLVQDVESIARESSEGRN